MESDPIGLQGGNNTYAYALGSPLRYSDHLGLAPPEREEFPPESAEEYDPLAQEEYQFLLSDIRTYEPNFEDPTWREPDSPVTETDVARLRDILQDLKDDEQTACYAPGTRPPGEFRRKPGSLGQFKGTDALRAENDLPGDAAQIAGLTPDQARQLHDEITGQNLPFVEILNGLRELQSLECWGIGAGEGTGSHATLHFGQKIPRGRALRNPILTEALRQYTGEFVIFIQNCAWRLDSECEVICTSKSPNANDGEMVRGFQSLVGKNVVSVLMAPPAGDLVVEFSRAMKLSLFCDCFDQDSDRDNYSFHNPRRVLIFGARGNVRSEARSPI